jgi:hypothetical protein
LCSQKSTIGTGNYRSGFSLQGKTLPDLPGMPAQQMLAFDVDKVQAGLFVTPDRTFTK